MPRKKPPTDRVTDRLPLVPDRTLPLHLDDSGRLKTPTGSPAPVKGGIAKYPWDAYNPNIQPTNVEGMEKGVSGHIGPFIEAQKVDDRAVPAKRYQAFISEPSSVLSEQQFPAGSVSTGPRSEDGTQDPAPSKSKNENFRGSASLSWDR